MNKSYFILKTGVIFFLIIGCLHQPVKSQQADAKNNYTGSYYLGNYVWGAAANLAWNGLAENVIKEKIKLKSNDTITVAMLDKFNNLSFSKTDLDEKSYYIKSGYGQKTIDEINHELKAAFPKKNFSDLKIGLKENDIISFAYLLKEVSYPAKFTKNEFSFKEEKVKGFYARGNKERENINIIYYENDDRFIVSLQLNEKEDELFLAKGFDMNNPEMVINTIHQHNKNAAIKLNERDKFEAPRLSFENHRDYVELMNKQLANTGFENYSIKQMVENIKFKMDEKGARVENKFVMHFVGAVIKSGEKPKYLILNKAYWVVMQRKNAAKPYFLLGINNTALMEKIN